MPGDLKQRVELLESQVADLQSAMSLTVSKDWRRAVEKYTGDPDLLAVFAEAKKLREAERKEVRKTSSRRAKR